VGELLGSIAFSLIVVGIIAGAWAWISMLFRKGLMALLGFERVCVQPFETVLLYRNGHFEEALPPGRHRIRAGSSQLTRIDLRPEVFRFTQGAVSADRIAIKLVYVVRTKIVDPRASFESTQNYRDEICARLQSVVKAVCNRKPRADIQMDHQSLGISVQKAASQVLRAIGCECLTFELLQVEVGGPVVDLDNRRTSAATHSPQGASEKGVFAAM
jgi:hypothetical protein